MSKILLIAFFVALCSLHAWSQTSSPVRVKGHILEKDTLQKLAYATVTLLYVQDSSRAVAAFTNEQGVFVMESVTPGNYYLHITYLGYKPLLKRITVTTDTLTDLGTIILQRNGVTLGMVEIVEIRAPMLVKKDTLEFNADYYKTRDNAVMEELLRKLPGVEIDKDGTIKVNGESVKRILVDGKPFFGDDPKLATRNLPADMIDKIQLLDKKSDQAQFSGASDGNTEKTVNVTTKKEKRNSFLGQLSAGYGTDERFAANVSLNRFGEQSLSLLGGGNNINGYQDGGMQIGGAGINRNWNGGVNYSTEINNALKIAGSYYMNTYNIVNDRIAARQNLLPDTSYYYDQDVHSVESSTSHVSEIRAEYKPDTLHTVIINSSINYARNNSMQEDIYQSFNDQKQLVNKGRISNISSGTSPTVNASAFFGKRFKKTGRTWSAGMHIGFINGKQQQFNESHNLFIQTDGEMLMDTIKQRNDIRNRYRGLLLYTTYTEPIYKDHFLDIMYSHNHSSTTASKQAYDYNQAKGLYDRSNDSLSNAFENTFKLQQSSISFRTQKQRYDYSIGISMQLSDLESNNVSEHSLLQKRTTGFFPVALFNYAFNNNRRFHFQYNGNTLRPDVALLQPVPDNSNPLYVQLGNPDLKPITTHTVSLNYNAANPQTFRAMTMYLSGSLIRNKVIMANWLDTLGRQVSQPFNANGAYNLSANITNSFPLKKKQMAVNIATAVVFSHDINYTNGQPGNLNNLYVGENVSFNYAYEQLLDFILRAGVNYSGVKYSQQKENNIDLYNYTLSFNGNLQLPLGFSLNGNVNYQHSSGVTAGYNQEVVMVNAYIAKSLFSKKQALIKVQGFDLLDQNQGFTRMFGAGYVEDVQTRVLQRFFMLSFSYFLK